VKTPRAAHFRVSNRFVSSNWWKEKVCLVFLILVQLEALHMPRSALVQIFHMQSVSWVDIWISLKRAIGKQWNRFCDI